MSTNAVVRVRLVDVDNTSIARAVAVILADLGVEQTRPTDDDANLTDVVVMGVPHGGRSDAVRKATELRVQAGNPQLPMLFVDATGATADGMAELFRLGTVDLLTHPLDHEVLHAKLSLLVNYARLTRARRADTNAGDDLGLTSADGIQAALRTAESRLQFALKAGRLGTWELDLLTNELHTSSICRTNYGRQPDDSFPYEDLAESVVEDDRARWRSAVADAITRAADLEVEYRARWPDGTVHWVYVRASCTTDALGQTIAMSGISLDIDEQKRAQERLLLLDTLNEATGTALDAATVMAVTTRLVGEHMNVMRCAYADVEPDRDTFTIRADYTADGVSTSAGVYSLDLFGSHAAAELRAGRTLVVRDVDRELAPADGADMFNAIGIKAIVCCSLLKAGEIVAMMALHASAPRAWMPSEVSLIQEVVARSWAHIERVRTDAALREQDRRKDEFLATLAHELRNPLAPIRTGLALLRMTPAGPAAEKTRAIMDRQLSHMVHIVDDLLDVSRISRGKVELKRDWLEIRAAVEHAVEGSRPGIDAAGHTLTVQMPEISPWIEGDLTRLAQVVSNLLDNAAKYTPNGGNIVLSLTVEDGEAVIRVIDDGAGISADTMPYVFDLFSQLNRTLDRAQGGLGIGLSLVRQLVTLHGGTIEAHSAGLGFGSTFTVRLPATIRPSQPAPPVSAYPHTDSAGSGLRILVVDDNDDGAELLATVLSMNGHETRIAHDGPEALDAAYAFVPELVFLDIGLPGMNGYAVAEHFRADSALASATLVALTGWGGADDRRRSKESGFDFHLTKPVDFSDVDKIVARLQARRS